jgi:uncharacterized lipoprotein YbaY
VPLHHLHDAVAPLDLKPWGSSARCVILADVKSAAEAFLQAATHAPQPMQAAESKALSAAVLGMRIALPSGAPPTLTDV